MTREGRGYVLARNGGGLEAPSGSRPELSAGPPPAPAVTVMGTIKMTTYALVRLCVCKSPPACLIRSWGCIAQSLLQEVID